MNHWLKKHLYNQDRLEIYENWNPISLSWNNTVLDDEMPILRDNYVERQGMWVIHMTELELERMNVCKVFTNS